MTDPKPQKAREAVFLIIRNQIRDGTPPETKQTYDRLIAEGHSQEETMRLIGCVVSQEIFEVLRQGRVYNEARYVAALKALPKLPWDDDAR